MPGSRRFPVSTRTLGTCELVNLGRGLRVFSLQGIRRLSPAFPGTCHHYQTIVFPELSVAKFLTRISQPPKRTLVFNSAFSRRSIYLEFSDDVRACLSSDGPRRTTTFLQVARQQMDIPSCAVVVNPRGRWHWVKGKTAPRSAHTAQVIRWRDRPSLKGQFVLAFLQTDAAKQHFRILHFWSDKTCSVCYSKLNAIRFN